MKKRTRLILFPLLISLLLTSCGLSGSRDVHSPYWDTTTPSAKPYEEVLLTELRYGDYALGGDNIPFYHRYGTDSSPFTVCGVPFADGVFISPSAPGKNGYIEYDISALSETFDMFVCKIGCLDGKGKGQEQVGVSFYIDGKLMSRTPDLSYGEEAYLIDVLIPYGAKTLRIECYTDSLAGNGSTVIGDGRFLHSQDLEAVIWPEDVNRSKKG